MKLNKPTKIQEGAGYNLGVDQKTVGGQAVVDKYDLCEGDKPVQLTSSGTQQVQKVLGNESTYSADQGSVSQEGGEKNVLKTRLRTAASNLSKNVSKNTINDLMKILNTYLSNEQSGGGYTFNLSAADQIMKSPPVVGYHTGSNGCTEMSKMTPPVSGYGTCVGTCDKNPYLVKPISQKGGKKLKLYKKITNPKTGKKVTLSSKTGQSLLKKYLKKLSKSGGKAPVNSDQGLPSDFSGDMTQREFGCKQPNWEPKCT